MKPRDRERDPLGTTIRELRNARRLTQDDYAARCGLAVDTIRRVEVSSFSPSLRTLRQLAGGLGVALPTLLELSEGYPIDADRELVDLVRLLPEERKALAVEMIRVLAK